MKLMEVLILGANGKIAKKAIELFIEKTDANLTLYLRKAERLSALSSERVKLTEGDTLDTENLTKAMENKDLVYANLSGDMELQAKSIITAMNQSEVKRLIFVTTLGILNEVPGKFGKWNNQQIGAYLPSYRKASELIEASDLNYTILRPAWLTDEDEIDYEITSRNEVFKGTEVSRKSVAAFVVEISKKPELYLKNNIGINKPNTDGEKPAFM